MVEDKIIKFYTNKTILITGHTGFKGSWLTLWLKYFCNCKIIGVSKDKPSKNSIALLNSKKFNIKEYFIDIRNFKKIENIFKKHKPDFTFHLAAQSLVSESIKDPQYTWETNLIGSLNIMRAFHNYNSKNTLILVTSDKCYKNFEKKSGYRETDILGGEDPYSASKASAEILFNSYCKTFLHHCELNIHLVKYEVRKLS